MAADCSQWRNRAEFPRGRPQIIEFLTRKWARELEYRLIKELWAFDGNRIAVRFAYEWHDDSGQWYRSYGNENWEFNEQGLMQRRFASINDLPIKASERLFFWPLGRRPDDHRAGSGGPVLRELVVQQGPPALSHRVAHRCWLIHSLHLTRRRIIIGAQ